MHPESDDRDRQDQHDGDRQASFELDGLNRDHADHDRTRHHEIVDREPGRQPPGDGYRRRIRKRRRKPLAFRLIRPLLEVGDSIVMLVRRHPLGVGVPSLILIWLLWPWLRPISLGQVKPGGDAPEVITAFVEDPQRTIGAMAIWKMRPGSTLILQGQPSSQAVNRAYLEHQGLWPSDERGIVRMTSGCDTVGQITSLARWLQSRPATGRLTIVTSPAHLDRSMAIARIVLGGSGWLVEGMPVVTLDNRPEAVWRLYRDQLRAQLWRVTGWEGTGDLHCSSRTSRVGPGPTIAHQ